MAEQKMHGFRARLDYVLKHNHFISALFRMVASACMRIWGVFVPVDDKMIIFTAHGRKYNDSPRAIYEYMLKSGKFNGFSKKSVEYLKAHNDEIDFVYNDGWQLFGLNIIAKTC